jgi:ABC-type uncharacterized transport system substrate-binding protein
MRLIGLAVIVALSVMLAPLAAQTQQAGKVARIGFLGGASASGYVRHLAALREGLHDLGHAEGRNIVIEYRWAEGRYDRLAGLAAELVRLQVDVIVTQGTPAARAAKNATRTIPIVMAIAGDPIGSGLIASLSRPGGNLTGSTFFLPELNAKRVELLKAALPRTSRMATLANPDNPAMPATLKAMESVANSLKVEFQAVEVRRPEEFPGVFSAMVQQRVDAVAVIEDGMLLANARQVADLAAKYRLPSIGFREYVDAGGLLAYAVDFPAIWRRAAIFIDKILKGGKPGDLPVEQPTKFELVINLKTAKTLGLTIPQSVLGRADQVIQ